MIATKPLSYRITTEVLDQCVTQIDTSGVR